MELPTPTMRKNRIALAADALAAGGGAGANGRPGLRSSKGTQIQPRTRTKRGLHISNVRRIGDVFDASNPLLSLTLPLILESHYFFRMGRRKRDTLCHPACAHNARVRVGELIQTLVFAYGRHNVCIS